jgi:hypothetical protein
VTVDARLAVPAGPDDPCYDFCLWPYEPVVDAAGGWRSETILLQSFAAAGVTDEGLALIEAIRRAFGPFASVWGIKEIGGVIAWEFYFYDYERLSRTRSASGFLAAVSDRHASTLRPPEGRPYFMFSVPFGAGDLRGRTPISELDLYIGNPGSTVSSGICYLFDADGPTLKNFYFFFDAVAERREAMRKLSTSAHFSEADVWPSALAWPELMTCKTVVVANKARSDALYFSRVTIDQVVWFLNKVGFRADIAALIAENRDRYRHLYFDVGYDFEILDGRPKVVKSSLYGYF